MTVFTTWLVTMGFFAVIFGVGLLLKYRERQNRMARRVSQAIHEDLLRSARASAAAAGSSRSWETSTYGTRYGELTYYERPPECEQCPSCEDWKRAYMAAHSNYKFWKLRAEVAESGAPKEPTAPTNSINHAATIPVTPAWPVEPTAPQTDPNAKCVCGSILADHKCPEPTAPTEEKLRPSEIEMAKDALARAQVAYQVSVEDFYNRYTPQNVFDPLNPKPFIFELARAFADYEQAIQRREPLQGIVKLEQSNWDMGKHK